jgi:argininosuccinate lyase
LKKKAKGKLWGGRFQGNLHPDVESFTASLSFDIRLFSYDIQGSIAHCKMLERVGILTATETRKMVTGLLQIQAKIEKGKQRFRKEDEDIHMAIERLLTEKVGAIGKKLHTGRSRNDQVVLDLRLFLRSEIKTLLEEIGKLQKILVRRAEKEIDALMPGYTHLQRAQPVRFSHHLLAYFEMFDRDRQRLEDSLERVNVMPLGSGALAGTTLPIRREVVAELLHFPKVTANSLDSVSDRDFSLEFLSAMAILMMHLSRFSEELILWSSQEFGFIELPDAFCTGSSMMPQKKNPDVPELIRGKTGRVYGHLVTSLTFMKGLPLSYNRDLQEDKEPIFDTVDTVKAALRLYQQMIEKLKINRDRLAQAAGDEFLLATDLAEYLVLKGVPFRDSHEVIGKLVGFCLKFNRTFSSLTLKEFQGFSKEFKIDVFDRLNPTRSVETKEGIGHPSRKRVLQRIRAIQKQASDLPPPTPRKKKTGRGKR